MDKAENNNEGASSFQQTEKKSENQNFEPMDTTSNTLKRNPKSELSKNDLLKLLSRFEGELQARDIVIAALKSEKVKQYLAQNRYLSHACGNDPIAALQRDNFATHTTEKIDICLLVNHQLNSLENLVIQQRESQARVAKILKEAEYRHRKEMELEKYSRRRFEREYIKLSDLIDMERHRHKQIVLFLLAERKKILMKLVEERKRSEDLAQILAEEKCRVDIMAEGLEEESKKSLRMEAELEKQLANFYTETQQLRLDLAKQTKRSDELENELAKSRNDISVLEKQFESYTKTSVAHQHVSHMQHSNSLNSDGIPTTVIAGINASCSVTSMMTSVAKVVQPTATISSVPVSSPMTGIARSVSPGQAHNVRYVMYTPVSVPVTHHVISAVKMSNVTYSTVTTVTCNAAIHTSTVPLTTITCSAQLQNDKKMAPPRAAVQPTVKMPLNNVIGKPNEQVASITPSNVRKHLSMSSVPKGSGRGVPPPIPPNKPVVPPKKEGMLTRKVETTVASEIAAPSDVKMNTTPRCNIPVISNRDKTTTHVPEKQLNLQVKPDSTTTTTTTENTI